MPDFPTKNQSISGGKTQNEGIGGEQGGEGHGVDLKPRERNIPLNHSPDLPWVENVVDNVGSLHDIRGEEVCVGSGGRGRTAGGVGEEGG